MRYMTRSQKKNYPHPQTQMPEQTAVHGELGTSPTLCVLYLLLKLKMNLQISVPQVQRRRRGVTPLISLTWCYICVFSQRHTPVALPQAF
jgi:hypothetical protein